MATPAEDREEEEAISLTELTAEIVAAYVGKNTVAIADIGPLIVVAMKVVHPATPGQAVGCDTVSADRGIAG